MQGRTWGIACIYAHRAYKDASLLVLAEQAWNFGYTYFITEDNAASGAHPERNRSFVASCNGRKYRIHMLKSVVCT
jgi:hypothetical protein